MGSEMCIRDRDILALEISLDSDEVRTAQGEWFADDPVNGRVGHVGSRVPRVLAYTSFQSSEFRLVDLVAVLDMALEYGTIDVAEQIEAGFDGGRVILHRLLGHQVAHRLVCPRHILWPAVDNRAVNERGGGAGQDHGPGEDCRSEHGRRMSTSSKELLGEVNWGKDCGKRYG